MALSLGPGKFYGTSLPRPRIYTDVKFNDHRVDPPTPVNEPLMSWAEEAHWSMGGLSSKRLRLQGKIEGNVQKLRSQREKSQAQAQAQSPTPSPPPDLRGSKRVASPSPPPAPVVAKHRRFMDLIEEDEVVVGKGRLVKKLGDEFDRVASEKERSDATPFKTRTRRLVKGGEPVKKTLLQETEKSKGKRSRSEAENGVRTSPRLAKRVSN
ncbi:uncharacterized protein LOC109810413 isoform X2 [Cajanus cajan]|uniref:uncharacterized protein LOC109810413 isoform X1 n=1 Tax=Cajanus cajan TaxID=3821 RepID=UPI00098D98F5|nr:uncharacterized protein LOC109810413 isoform X1 [Cajanus cajan]XP_020229462.1 uncharacterized protein LOC109810413 isoform X2 [Cajanus cajan]